LVATKYDPLIFYKEHKISWNALIEASDALIVLGLFSNSSMRIMSHTSGTARLARTSAQLYGTQDNIMDKGQPTMREKCWELVLYQNRGLSLTNGVNAMEKRQET